MPPEERPAAAGRDDRRSDERPRRDADEVVPRLATFMSAYYGEVRLDEPKARLLYDANCETAA
jgi:hypothetical protein